MKYHVRAYYPYPNMNFDDFIFDTYRKAEGFYHRLPLTKYEAVTFGQWIGTRIYAHKRRNAHYFAMPL